MTVQIIRGDALHLPLDDDTVDLVVTSPPYFGLRSYTDAGEHYDGQLGSEATPAEFVDALIAATREMVRVVKPSGSIFVNLGDKYAGSVSGGTQNGNIGVGGNVRSGRTLPKDRGRYDAGGIPIKSLMGLPWRYALRCIDDLGLILRAEIVWSKPNGLPESVTDRVRRSHEQWFSFQQSGNEVVEAGSERLPLCPLCGRPKDARATLVRRLHELEASVEDADLADHVGPDERVELEHCVGAEQPGVVGLECAPVPLAVPGHGDGVEDAAHLLDDRSVAVVDQDSQMGAPVAPVREGDRPLAVDDSGQPGEVCSCSHPLIIDDEPWMPQELAAEIMQMVANGEVDAQHAADFLSGDYARTHSTWFHFTLEPRYYSAVDTIREDSQQARPQARRAEQLAARAGLTDAHREALRARGLGDTGRGAATQDGTGKNTADVLRLAAEADAALGGYTREFLLSGPAFGKLPGSVWTIPTQPLTVPAELGVDHFAAFPMEWPRRIIRGWSPSGICTACGQGRRPVALAEYDEHGAIAETDKARRTDLQGNTFVTRALGRATRSTTITGESCGCDTPTAPTRPAVVLDPFGGTGTTALVAHALARHGVSVDMSADYCRLATWRTTDPGQLAAALEVPKPDPVADGQLDLLDGIAL